MNGKYLLDTNIVVALFADEQMVIDRATTVENVLIPSIVIGELYYGAQKSSRVQRKIARIDNLVKTRAIVPCDVETARYYGEIKSDLKKKGRPIPDNDIWIAALTHQHRCILVTRDKHFSEVDLIQTVSW